MDLTNIRNLMKQAQQMQEKMQELQERLAGERVEATAGGGMVTAVVNGRHEMISLKLNPQVVDQDDVEMLEDLIMSAVNEANRMAQERMQQEMSRLTGGLGMPGMF